MSGYTKLFYIACFPQQHGDGYTPIALVKGYIADLPKTSEAMRLQFRQVGETRHNKDFEIESRDYACCATYNSHTDEILWANIGQPRSTASNSWNYTMNLWRFGQYFELRGMEHLPCTANTEVEPSVIIEGSIVSCGVAHSTWDNHIETFFPDVSQKGPNDKAWKIVTFNSAHSTPMGPQSVLFTNNDTDIKYVYNVRVPQQTGSGTILLDVMKSDRFNNLTQDSSQFWQSFEVYVNFKVYSEASDVHEGLKMALTRDEDNKKWRLYFFKYERDPNQLLIQVHMSHIALRSDGSVETHQNRVWAANHGSLILPGGGWNSGLKAFVFEKKIMLLCRGGFGISGLIAPIASDGSIPEDQNAWNTVYADFPDMPAQTAGRMCTMTGCMVPDSFAP